MMVYSDDVLSDKCAVGKKGAKHQPIDNEELGILKGILCLWLHTLWKCHYHKFHRYFAGFLQSLYTSEKVCSAEVNTIVNSACCGARRRKNSV